MRELPIVTLQPQNTELTVKMREVSYAEARSMDSGSPEDVMDLFASKILEIREATRNPEGSNPVNVDELTLSEMSGIIEAYMQLATPNTANPTLG